MNVYNFSLKSNMYIKIYIESYFSCIIIIYTYFSLQQILITLNININIYNILNINDKDNDRLNENLFIKPISKCFYLLPFNKDKN